MDFLLKLTYWTDIFLPRLSSKLSVCPLLSSDLSDLIVLNDAVSFWLLTSRCCPYPWILAVFGSIFCVCGDFPLVFGVSSKMLIHCFLSMLDSLGLPKDKPVTRLPSSLCWRRESKALAVSSWLESLKLVSTWMPLLASGPDNISSLLTFKEPIWLIEASAS